MIRLNDNYDIISKYKNISRDGGQHNSARQIVHRVRQIGRKILLAPEERGHHVIWRQLGRRFRAKFWLAAKFASRAVSHQLHRRWHEDVRIAWYVRYPCLSAFIERRQDCLGEGKVCRLDTVLGDGQRGRLSLASSLNVDQGHGITQLRGDHIDQTWNQPGVPRWSRWPCWSCWSETARSSMLIKVNLLNALWAPANRWPQRRSWVLIGSEKLKILATRS